MEILPACMSVYHMHTLRPQKPEEGFGCPATGVTDGCELQCRCWTLEADSLGKPQVFLIAAPSLQLLNHLLNLNM